MHTHFCHLIFQLWVVWCELRKKRKLRNCWHGMKLGWPSYLFGKPTIKAQVCNNLWFLTKITVLPEKCFFSSHKRKFVNLGLYIIFDRIFLAWFDMTAEFFKLARHLEIIRIVFEKSSYPVLGFCHLTYFLLIKENAFFW